MKSIKISGIKRKKGGENNPISLTEKLSKLIHSPNLIIVEKLNKAKNIETERSLNRNSTVKPDINILPSIYPVSAVMSMLALHHGILICIQYQHPDSFVMAECQTDGDDFFLLTVRCT